MKNFEHESITLVILISQMKFMKKTKKLKLNFYTELRNVLLSTISNSTGKL